MFIASCYTQFVSTTSRLRLLTFPFSRFLHFTGLEDRPHYSTMLANLATIRANLRFCFTQAAIAVAVFVLFVVVHREYVRSEDDQGDHSLVLNESPQT